MVSSVGGERKQSWHKCVCLINEEASWAFLIPIPHAGFWRAGASSRLRTMQRLVLNMAGTP